MPLIITNTTSRFSHARKLDRVQHIAGNVDCMIAHTLQVMQNLHMILILTVIQLLMVFLGMVVLM